MSATGNVRKGPFDARVLQPPILRRVALDFCGRGGVLMGGPYRHERSASPGAFRVKVAVEQAGDADLVLPVSDFGVPDAAEFRRALRVVARELLAGGSVFVGCGYGIGRTGTFLAGLFKLHDACMAKLIEGYARRDPVVAVRTGYYSGAVETRAQELFVRGLDVEWLARRIVFGMSPFSALDKRFWLA